MNFILKCVSSLALSIGGWRTISQDTIIELQEPCRKVAVIPHTSYWDYFWGLMYCIRYDLVHKVRFAMAPKVYDKFTRYPMIGSMIRQTCIRVTPREETNGGSVDQIVETLNAMGDFILMIAPAGTRTDDPRAKWRSGFIHICQKTQADLCILGVDYSRNHHTCRMKEISSPVDESLLEPESEIRQLVSEYGSLNSSREDVYNLDPVTLSILAPLTISLSLYVMSVLGSINNHNLDSSLVATFTFIVSFLHHSNGESEWELSKLHTMLVVICHSMWLVKAWVDFSYIALHDFYLMNQILLVSLYSFFLCGGHMVGSYQFTDEGQMEWIRRDGFYESTMVFHNLFSVFVLLFARYI